MPNTNSNTSYFSSLYSHARNGLYPGSVQYLALNSVPCAVPLVGRLASIGLASIFGTLEGAVAGLAIKLGNVIAETDGASPINVQMAVLSSATAGAVLKCLALSLDFFTASLQRPGYSSGGEIGELPTDLPQYVRQRQPVKFNTVKVGLFRTAKGAVAGAVKGAAFGLAVHLGSKIVQQGLPDESVIPIGTAVASAALGGLLVNGGYELADSINVHFRGL